MGLKIGEPTFCVRDPSLQSLWKIAMSLFKRLALEKQRVIHSTNVTA